MRVRNSSDRIWLFSGVSSGLGEQWARYLLKQGDQVVGITRQADLVGDLQRAYPHQFIPLEADIVNFQTLRSSLDFLMDEKSIPYFSHVICAAGFAHFGTIEDVNPADLEKSFLVNVVGSRNVAVAGLERMRSHGDRRILFVSSMAGLHCWPNLGTYQISKYGVRALSDTLREELAQHGVQVGCLYPGPHLNTGWATKYAKRTSPSLRYDAKWLEKNSRCGFELFNPAESLKAFKHVITSDPMPAYSTTHREVAEMCVEDHRGMISDIKEIGE